MGGGVLACASFVAWACAGEDGPEFAVSGALRGPAEGLELGAPSFLGETVEAREAVPGAEGGVGGGRWFVGRPVGQPDGDGQSDQGGEHGGEERAELFLGHFGVCP
jgi:hypothetical protein